ncbi:MAG: DNA-binding response OmpR family regulator [Planctomycetota bacterium]|jgi:DNA-binding response OmpR family regulator
MRVLIVEDDRELRGAIARRLRALGHGVDTAQSCEEARWLLGVHVYASIILDRLLPDGDSVEHLRAWRRSGVRTPVLILTALDQVDERLLGFESGADDYLIKPFVMEELLARVAAVARRGDVAQSSIVEIGGVHIDKGRREVRRSGDLIPLRPKEYALLELLVSRVNQVVSRSEIYQACWDESRESLSNVEEALVAALRRKLGDPVLIRTIRGHGYMLEESSCE